MAYNGSSEDPQNWPFSVRYTASPYRKSKFPVPPETSGPPPPLLIPPTGTAGDHMGQQPHLSQFQLQPHQEHILWGIPPYYTNNGNSAARGFQYHQYHNGNEAPTINSNNVGLGNYNQHPHHQHLYYQQQPSYQQYCFLQQQAHFHPPHPGGGGGGLNNGNSEGQYGLPLPAPFQSHPHHQHYTNQEQQYFTRNQNPRTRTRYPPTHLQQFLKQQQRQMVSKAQTFPTRRTRTNPQSITKLIFSNS